MGLLPQIADGVGVSIPTAGHLISAYALGVVVGAPLIAVFGAKLPRRALLVWLMVAYAVFNVLSAVASSYGVLFVARFLDGLPHGAYFGVASLVAASLAAPGPPGPRGRQRDARPLGRQRRRRARGDLARPAARLARGVPRRVGLALLTHRADPRVRAVAARATRPPPAAGSCCSSATARRCSRCSPARSASAACSRSTPTSPRPSPTSAACPTRRSRSSPLPSASAWWPAPGWPAGWPSGRCFRTLIWSGIGSGLVMLAGLGWSRRTAGGCCPVIFLVTAIGSVLVVNLQLRLMAVSGEAQTLGAAMNHASLNLANALGAWLGGAGHRRRATATGRPPWSARRCRWPASACCCGPPRFTAATSRAPRPAGRSRPGRRGSPAPVRTAWRCTPIRRMPTDSRIRSDAVFVGRRVPREPLQPELLERVPRRPAPPPSS